MDYSSKVQDSHRRAPHSLIVDIWRVMSFIAKLSLGALVFAIGHRFMAPSMMFSRPPSTGQWRFAQWCVLLVWAFVSFGIAVAIVRLLTHICRSWVHAKRKEEDNRLGSDKKDPRESS